MPSRGILSIVLMMVIPTSVIPQSNFTVFNSRCLGKPNGVFSSNGVLSSVLLIAIATVGAIGIGTATQSAHGQLPTPGPCNPSFGCWEPYHIHGEPSTVPHGEPSTVPHGEP
jgi:hypothetical protein